MTGYSLLVAAACLLAAIVSGRLARVWLGLMIAGAGSALFAALRTLLGASNWEWKSQLLFGSEPLSLRLDGISALFLVLVAVVGAAGAIYARGYWTDHHYPGSAPRGRSWWSALVLSMGGVLLSANGLHFLIAWELFAICGYFLITLENKKREVRAAGWLYLAASHAGTLALFAFFATLAVRTGSWQLGPMRQHPELAPLFWVALFGFGMKAGFFPLHIWLPSAHANAPSHVSAIMSGVAIKMGLYGLVRFSGWLPLPHAAGWVVIGIGAASALLGIAFALAQNDLKRLLAYCSVENMGIILIGLGGALLAASHGDAAWGRLALAGALLHVWNHGAFKSLLFFGAGSVLHTAGTREMSRLGGLWRTMPWTAGLFGVGVLAVAGLPPLNGFVSEWLVYLGLFDAATGRGPAAWPAAAAAIMLAMSGAIALASFTKAAATIFLGAPRTKAAECTHESGKWMLGTMVGIAAVCLLIALAPVAVWPAIARAVGEWHPAWAGAEAPAPLFKVGFAQVALALLGLIAMAALWRKAQGKGLRRSLTWDCGYAAPTARMQYTSGSFAGIVTQWFGWILQRERKVRRPRGYFPAGAVHLERTPETVLERLIAPVGAGLLRVSTAVRALQHGRLQLYVLYVLAGLLALFIFVILGVRQ